MKIGIQFPIHRLSGASGPLALGESAFTVLYFYPKDMTTWCSLQAREFQKLKPEFDSRSVRIVGVSRDGADSHGEFCRETGIGFELATDAEGKLGEELGIMSGGLHKRVTYLIDRRGLVVRYYPDARATENALQVLEDVKAIAG